MLEKIQQAYQADRLLGSYLTMPVKNYQQFFLDRTAASEDGWEKAAWVIAHIVSGVLAYSVLGAVAAIGVFVNLFFIPCGTEEEPSYSLVDRICFVPSRVEAVCTDISGRIDQFNLESRMVAEGRMGSFSGGSAASRGNPRDYSRNQVLSFFMQGGEVTDEGRNLVLEQIRNISRRNGVVLDSYREMAHAHPQHGAGIRFDILVPDTVLLDQEPFTAANQLDLSQHHVQRLEAP